MEDLNPVPGDYEKVLAWWATLEPKVRRRELDDFAVEFAYHSAKVERADITYEEADEVFRQGTVTAYTGDVRSLISVVNQKAAFGWMLEALEEGRPLSESMVLTLHRTLTYGTFSAHQLADGERPGTYKLSDYFVRETHEVGAPVEEVAQLTQALLAEVNDVLDGLGPERALTVAAYLHNELVTIHPFSEGTGRVARELMDYVLLRGGHPPLIIFEDDKPLYFETLEAFDDTGDLAPFKELLVRSTVRSWEDRVRG